jgi:hypothetical protein
LKGINSNQDYRNSAEDLAYNSTYENLDENDSSTMVKRHDDAPYREIKIKYLKNSEKNYNSSSSNETRNSARKHNHQTTLNNYKFKSESESDVSNLKNCPSYENPNITVLNYLEDKKSNK